MLHISGAGANQGPGAPRLRELTLSQVETMRKLNPIFLTTLIAVVTVIGVGTHFLHDFQVKRNALALFEFARRSEAEKRVDRAERTLKEYLNILPDDGPAWSWYARLADERDWARRDQQKVFLVHEQALQHNPGDRELERHCVTLALERGLRRYSDAKNHLGRLIDGVSNDSQGQPSASQRAEMAELEELQGQCDQGLTRYGDAENWFVKAIEHDPARVSCYDRLARLRRNELRRIGEADGTIDQMVAKNHKSGRAHLYK